MAANMCGQEIMDGQSFVFMGVNVDLCHKSLINSNI